MKLLQICMFCLLALIGNSVLGQPPSSCGYDQVLCTFLPHFQNNDSSAINLYIDSTWVDNDTPIYIKIYVHVIRTDSAEGGLTLNQIQQSLSILRKDFIKANIYFLWDCNIYYVNDSDQYMDYDGDQNHLIFYEDPHFDGIDIYFYPELSSEISSGKGSSQCIVNGSAVYVAGNNAFGPVNPLYTTSVISHEIGHSLGLLHTEHCFHSPDHLNCVQENPPSATDNGKVAGDFIDDTPADPGLFSIISSEDCEYHGNPSWDPDGTILTPDVTNIMSNTNAFCMEAFSDDQVYMMRKFIHLQDSVALNVFKFDTNHIDVTVNTQWNYSSFPNGELTVRDNITVKAGKQLTIGDSVKIVFSPQAKLIVEPGAILYLNGTLTSFCNQGWKGVEVWGNKMQTQYFYGGHFYQGKILASSTAIIENAEIGIYVSGEDSHTQSGGVVVAQGTLFRNNSISVLFSAYQNYYPSESDTILKDNLSFFRGCTFEINDNYCVNKAFEEFIWMLEVDGIWLETCLFQNLITEEQQVWRDYGIGIRATDATFHVNRFCKPDESPCDEENQCLFDGLAYGIFNTGIFGNKPYSVKNSEFRDCYVGIYQSQVSDPTVIVNRFNLGTVRDENLMAEQFGYFIEGAVLGMDIQENTFTSESGNVDATFGIYSLQLGGFSNIIRRNTFSGLNYANVAEGKNLIDVSGLYYECNFNYDNTEFDFSVMLDTATEDNQGIREIQGITDPQFGTLLNGAGNIFYHNSGNSESDFYNNANDTMRYLYGNYTNREPLYYSDDIIVKSLANNNLCVQDYCVELCKTESELDDLGGDYADADSDLTSLLPYLYYTSGSINRTIQARIIPIKATMDEIVRLQLHHISYDTLGRSATDFRDWLERGKVYESDILYVNSLARENEWTSAVDLLDELPSKYDLADELLEEHERYNFIISLLENAFEDDRSFYELTKPELNLLDSIRSVSFSLAKRSAANILNLYGVNIPLRFQIPDEGIQERSVKENQHSVGGTKGKFIIFPNPSIEQIHLLWSPIEGKEGEFTIYNTEGVIKYEFVIDLSTNHLSLDISNLSIGIHFYRFKVGTGFICYGKLVKL